MRLPNTIEAEIRIIEAAITLIDCHQAGVPRLRGLRGVIEAELLRLLGDIDQARCRDAIATAAMNAALDRLDKAEADLTVLRSRHDESLATIDSMSGELVALREWKGGTP